MRILWLGLAALLIFGCSPENKDLAGEGINWIHDYQSGLDQARQSDKSMMLFFTADWCPPCIELKKQVFTDAGVVDASKSLVNIYIDVDQKRQIMRAHRVRGIPAVFFLDPKGDKIGVFKGPRNAKNFIKFMRAAAKAAEGAG